VVVGLETARQEWEEGLRQLEAQRADRTRYVRLLTQVEVVTDELRRRLGQTYAVADLARSYGEAETWARDAVSERAASPGWARDLTMVVAASFHAYQRGAVDYQP
jgi:hypothetical protein